VLLLRQNWERCKTDDERINLADYVEEASCQLASVIETLNGYDQRCALMCGFFRKPDPPADLTKIMSPPMQFGVEAFSVTFKTDVEDQKRAVRVVEFVSTYFPPEPPPQSKPPPSKSAKSAKKE